MPNSDHEQKLITFKMSLWEGHLVLGALGLQAETDGLPKEEMSAMQDLRDKLVEQFNSQDNATYYVNCHHCGDEVLRVNSIKYNGYDYCSVDCAVKQTCGAKVIE